MKKFLLGTVALVALGATVPALAADLGARAPYAKAPAYAAPIYNWTGFYIAGRVLGGVQAGADYQFANWVLGIEGQYSWLGGNNTGAIFPGGFVYTNNQRGLGSVTGRVGYTWGPGLLYVKGGYAFSDNNETLALAGAPVVFGFDHGHRDGYTVGAGLEYMFAQNWSAKVEYQYYDFGSSRFVTPAVLVPFGSFRNSENTIKAGLNYRFNWGAPAVAKY